MGRFSYTKKKKTRKNGMLLLQSDWSLKLFFPQQKLFVIPNVVAVTKPIFLSP